MGQGHQHRLLRQPDAKLGLQPCTRTHTHPPPPPTVSTMAANRTLWLQLPAVVCDAPRMRYLASKPSLQQRRSILVMCCTFLSWLLSPLNRAISRNPSSTSASHQRDENGRAHLISQRYPHSKPQSPTGCQLAHPPTYP